MVLILPKVKSFGERAGEALGGGLQQGVGKSVEMAQAMALENYKNKQRMGLLGAVEGGRTPIKPNKSFEQVGQPEDIREKFLSVLPQYEQAIEQTENREATPEDYDALWNFMNSQTDQRGSEAASKRQMQSEKMTQDPFEKAKKYAALGEHELARVAMEEAKLGEKLKLEERKEAHSLAKPTLERGRELLEDIPYKENALLTMQDAISSGNLGMLSLDNLAELTGIEGLRSPEGAAFKTASKEFFLGNLSRVGARGLNQMMERVVLEMSPLIGRSTEANLAVTEILGAETDVTRKEAELINDIGQDYKEKHGYYPENLQHLVYKQLKPYAQQRQKEALQKVDKIKSLYTPKNKEGVLMYDPAGNLRRVPHQNKKEALQQGYRTP